MHPGLTGTASLTVSAADTASALGSGDVDVLATPRVLALAEAATVAAVADAIADHETSVGTHVSLDHRRPTKVGATVVATATLMSVDGPRLRFEVEVVQGDYVIAGGVIERVVVDRERFLRR